MKPTIKMLILLIAASIAYSLESFTCTTSVGKADSSMFKTREGETAYLESYNNALRIWPVKYEEVDLKTAFGKAHVIISGPQRGNPLVLLHGMNASSTMWYANVKELSKDHRIYAIDFIKEPGKSVLQKDLKTKEDLVKWYSEVFEKLNLDHFDLVGESRGGWLALQLALHSDKIKKLVLISPAQTFVMVKPKVKVLRNFIYNIHPERTQLKSILKTMSANVDNIAPEWREQYYTCLSNMRTDLEMFKMDIYTDDELRSVKIPVLVLIGDQDIINDEKSLERAKKILPDAETKTINRSGHFVSIDQAETVNKEILNFLQKQ
jgi:pimeloyl-ACP methyl ester carboxylesterase